MQVSHKKVQINANKMINNYHFTTLSPYSSFGKAFPWQVICRWLDPGCG